MNAVASTADEPNEIMRLAAICRLAENQSPLSFVGVMAVECREFVSSVRRCFSMSARSRSVVAQEYDRGVWADLLAKQPWHQFSSLAAYLAGDDPSPIVARLAGSLFRVRRTDYYAARALAIAEAVGTLDGGRHPITELGCGAGMNCLSLAQGGWPDVLGVDSSENGVAAATAAARHFSAASTRFAVHDALQPVTAESDPFRGRTVFTYLCLEQLGRHLDSVITNLLASKPNRVIHFENAWELLSPWSLGDLSTALHIHASDYQKILLRVLRRFEAAGALTIERFGRLRFSPTPKNDLMVVVWRPAIVPKATDVPHS